MNQKFSLKELWDSGAAAPRLDLFRIVFSLTCLMLTSRLIPLQAFDIPQCMWNPPGIAKFFLSSPLSFLEIKWAGIILKMSLVTLGLGFLTRISAAICCLLSIILLGTYHAAFYFNTSGNSLVLTFFILALAPSLGTTYSVDSLWRRQKMNFSDADKIWPQRLIHFLFFFLFFAAGVSKLLGSENWTDANNLIALLKWAREHYGADSGQPLRDSIHHFLISSPRLVHYGGLAVIGIELSALLFFFFRRLTPYGAILLASLHVGIVLSMYFTYILILPLYMIFVPWEKLVRNRKFGR